MITIIYPYRDRDLNRLKYSFDSLKRQTVKEFEVFFVDYGSTAGFSSKVKDLVKKYSFINYTFLPTQHQPWNKAKALNYIIKTLENDFFFVADVDIYFHEDFLRKAIKLSVSNSAVYFQVGFLKPGEAATDDFFKDSQVLRKSTDEATGLSLFPVEHVRKLNGFDEFYHFWGAEDTDIHVRLRNAGYEVKFYSREVLLLHQWHPSYRSLETKKLTDKLQITGIVQLNHQHLKFAVEHKVTTVNEDGWGNCLSSADLELLKEVSFDLRLQNSKLEIDHLLYALLPSVKNQVLRVRISEDRFQHSQNYLIKKLLRKKVTRYYSLKEINDHLLLHVISFYRDRPYVYRVFETSRQIELSIAL